ncbi:MAG: FG-GAP repeat domain-containing protein [Gammaproteobacteria bacterium]
MIGAEVTRPASSLMRGKPSISTTPRSTPHGAPSLICCRDFNGDGKADILWRDTAGSTTMWFMNGAAVAGQSLLPSVAASWTLQ